MNGRPTAAVRWLRARACERAMASPFLSEIDGAYDDRPKAEEEEEGREGGRPKSLAAA